MDYLRACVFDWRKKKAIRQAKRDANLYGKKYLVLVHNGRPVCELSLIHISEPTRH